MIRTFDVKGTQESDAVASPSSAIGGKEVGLNGRRIDQEEQSGNHHG